MEEKETEKLLTYYGNMNLSNTASLDELKQFNKSADCYLQEKMKTIRDQEIDVSLKCKRFLDLKNKYLMKRMKMKKDLEQNKQMIDDGLINYCLNRLFSFDQQNGGNIPSEDILLPADNTDNGVKHVRYTLRLKDANGSRTDCILCYLKSTKKLDAIYTRRDMMIDRATEREVENLSLNLEAFVSESIPFGIKRLIEEDVREYSSKMGQENITESFLPL